MTTELICPNCQTGNSQEITHCQNCGFNLRETVRSDEKTAFVPEPTRGITDLISSRKAYFPRQATLILELPDHNQRLTADLSKNGLTIGRKPESNASLPHLDLSDYGANEKGVSRQHIRITRINATLVLEDLATLNGTFVNGERLSSVKPHVLSDGDELRLGKLKLKAIFERPEPISS